MSLFLEPQKTANSPRKRFGTIPPIHENAAKLHSMTQTQRSNPYMLPNLNAKSKSPEQSVAFARLAETTANYAQKAQQTDKTFRIAKPMRKVSWTKRFAAGERSVRWAGCEGEYENDDRGE